MITSVSTKNKFTVSFITIAFLLVACFLGLLFFSVIKATGHHATINHLASTFSLYYFILSFVLVIVIGIYSKRYLKGEDGVERFWSLYFTFAVGLMICSFSINLETFFIGWELVGLASFFLIGFYQKNPRAIENSLLALANYKTCDVFFIMAIFLEQTEHSFLAGLCLILATLAKSAQFPFSSWLYRSLEGPTPSSTAFYGGLSLHLGPFLLLQFHSIWDTFNELKLLLIAIGSITALYGFLVGNARSDIKTSLAFASLSQVGIIFVEIGFGLYNVAIWHIIAHSILRTWNYLRTSSYFNDLVKLDFNKNKSYFKSKVSKLYFHALNNFYLDQLFISTRKMGLCLYLIFIGLYLVFYAKNLILKDMISLAMILGANILTVYCFIRSDIALRKKLFLISFSQMTILISMWIIEENNFSNLESLRLHLTSIGISIATLFLVYFALRPAFLLWDSNDEYSSEYFLGLKKRYTLNSIFYFVSAISLSALPGTIQYFFQEEETFYLWKISPLIAMFVLSGLAFNSFHIFKIGCHAFFGNFEDRKSLY